jgi:hypothetical protein
MRHIYAPIDRAALYEKASDRIACSLENKEQKLLIEFAEFCLENMGDNTRTCFEDFVNEKAEAEVSEIESQKEDERIERYIASQEDY